MSEYIDREAAKLNTMSLIIYCNEEPGDMWISGIYDALVSLREVPAANVRPVVRGEWIQNADGNCVCSVCNLGLSNCAASIFFKYCPFCGADMRKENENA